MKSVSTDKKLEAVNAALQEFASDTWVERGERGWTVKWKRGDRVFSRRWQVIRGTDFYPAWHRHWGHGGTCCNALAQLIRWLQDRPVLPISTWRHWTGEGVKLGTPKIIEILTAAGYPQSAKCIKCDRVISGQFDWFKIGKTSGAGHYRECPNKN